MKNDQVNYRCPSLRFLADLSSNKIRLSQIFYHTVVRCVQDCESGRNAYSNAALAYFDLIKVTIVTADASGCKFCVVSL